MKHYMNTMTAAAHQRNKKETQEGRIKGQKQGKVNDVQAESLKHENI